VPTAISLLAGNNGSKVKLDPTLDEITKAGME